MCLTEFGVRTPRVALVALILIPTSIPLFSSASAQTGRARARQFPPHSLQRLQDLPPGRFRNQTDQLTPVARQRTLAWLQAMHFTEIDLETMHIDSEGGVFFVDENLPDTSLATAEAPTTAEATVPVLPFPASLILHSRPGAPNVLHLNFTGEHVTETAWNTSLGRTSITDLGGGLYHIDSFFDITYEIELDPSPPSDVEVVTEVQDDTLIVDVNPNPRYPDDIRYVVIEVQPKEDEYVKGIPPLDQLDPSRLYGGGYHCAPTATAACLKYFNDDELDGGLSGVAQEGLVGDSSLGNLLFSVAIDGCL